MGVWGSIVEGESGNGQQFENFPFPQLVPGLTNVQSIAMTSFHCLVLFGTKLFCFFWVFFSCILINYIENSTVAGWGDNQFGQVGCNSSSENILVPTILSGLSNVQQICAGYYFSLALQSNYCFVFFVIRGNFFFQY